MEKFIPMELLRRKGNTTRGITFSRFYQNDQNLSAPFAWITRVPYFPSRESEKFPVFVFSMRKNIPLLFVRNFLLDHECPHKW